MFLFEQTERLESEAERFFFPTFVLRSLAHEQAVPMVGADTVAANVRIIKIPRIAQEVLMRLEPVEHYDCPTVLHCSTESCPQVHH